MIMRLAWRMWERTPEALRRPLRPLLAVSRRRARAHTPLPPGPAPDLPDGAVALDTSIGTLWFDTDDTHLTPWIRSQGVWEADVMKLLRRRLRPGDVFVDVGANVGFHSVLAGQLVGPRGHVYAVEPAFWTLELLRANLWRHGTPATVLPYAACDAPGAGRLAVEHSHRSGARIDTGSDGIEVLTARLDDLLPDVSAAVLKVDVEGAEPAVLRGAVQLIRRSPQLIIVVEFRDETHIAGESPAEVLAFYESLGFDLCLLRRTGELLPTSQVALLKHSRRFPSVNIALCKRGASSLEIH